MARSYAKVLATVWQDPDWCALRPREQWAFTLLLSQPRLSLVGCLDYMPARWTSFGAGLTVEYLDGCLDGLEDARYICIDHKTDEILVRSFTRHDGIPIANERLRKGLWGAYHAVTSAPLRRVAVDNMPGELFDHDHPDEAERFRRSEPMDWVTERVKDYPIEHPIERVTDSPSALSLPPEALRLEPSDARRPASSNGLATVAPFDEFWSAYPRKIAKGAARKAWPAAVKRAGDAATVTAGATRYATDPYRDHAFTKHPATWLNADCWDDELTPPPASLSKGTLANLAWAERTS